MKWPGRNVLRSASTKRKQRGRYGWVRCLVGVSIVVAALVIMTGCGTQIRNVTANARYKTAFQPGCIYVLRQSALLEVWNHPTRYALISNSAANLRWPPPECGPWVYEIRNHDHRDYDKSGIQQCPPASLARLKQEELRPNRDAHVHRQYAHRPENPFRTHHRRQNPWIRTDCPAGTRIKIIGVDLLSQGRRRQLMPLGTILTGPLAGLHVWLGGISYVNPFTHLLQANPIYLAGPKSVQ